MYVDGPYPGDMRRFPRVNIQGSAQVLAAKGLLGVCRVENLSEGGALLIGGLPLTCGEKVRVLLMLDPGPALGDVEAIVTRRIARHDSPAFAVRFTHVAWRERQMIRAAVAAALRTTAAPRPVVLVVDAAPLAASRMAHDIESVGREAVSVVTPLDAITWLDPPDVSVEATIVDAALDGVDGLSMLEFFAADYPAIRRVLSCAEGERQYGEAVEAGRVHALLVKPWDRDALARALNLRE